VRGEAEPRGGEADPSTCGHIFPKSSQRSEELPRLREFGKNYRFVRRRGLKAPRIYRLHGLCLHKAEGHGLVLSHIQVDVDDTVGRPLALVPLRVGHEDDMRGFEHHLLRGVLGVEHEAVLQLLCHGVEAMAEFCLCTADVHYDNASRLCAESILHVSQGAREGERPVLAQEVPGEPGLAFVADGVRHPDDVAVIGGLGNGVQQALLPGAGLEGGVLGHVLGDGEVGLQAPVVVDEDTWHGLSDSPEARGFGKRRGLSNVTAVTLAVALTILPWAGNAGVLLGGVFAGLVNGALTGLDVGPRKEGDGLLERVAGDLLGELDESLHVQVGDLLELVARVAHKVNSSERRLSR